MRKARDVRQARIFHWTIIVFLACAYAIYFLFDQDSIRRSGIVSEDGLYENLTAIFFLLASASLLKAYFSHKNIFLALLAFVMFCGAGEELSWGQRIFGFSTPGFIRESNVQGEFTLHNLEIVNGHSFDREQKYGVAKLITINFLFKAFWLGFTVILPLAYRYWQPVSWLARKIRIPIPPLDLGIFFLANWLIFRVSAGIAMADNGGVGLYRFTEVLECCTAFLFVTLSIHFLMYGPACGDTKSERVYKSAGIVRG